MTSTGQIEIPLSKKKLLLMLIGSIGFIVAGVWFSINPPKINNPLFGNPVFIFVISIASILFFGICAIYIAKKLSESKPGLIIDNEGLTDNSSGLSVGKVMWNEIEDISVIEIQRQKIILIHMKDPQSHINKQTSGFKRKIMQMNLNSYGTPMSVTSNALQINFDDLLNILTNHLNESRK